ncbi:hypothetical protein [Tenacibaculum salmonis]|uniref:hypothetical protein n=1 Tax=Tenacibaculum sp. P3-BQ1 TaxID=3232310 RepID=UPI0034DFAAF3
MKKNVLIIFILFQLFGCEKHCQDDCKGFDFDNPIFQWHLFPNNIDSISFVSNTDKISLIKKNYSVSEAKLIEYECTQAAHLLFGNPNFQECQEKIVSEYSFSSEQINEKISSSIDDSTSSKNPRLHIGFQRGFDLTLESNNNLSISGTYYNSVLMEEAIINGQNQKNVLIISANQLAVEKAIGSIITKLWIIKGKGMVQFQIDDNIIWTRENIL